MGFFKNRKLKKQRELELQTLNDEREELFKLEQRWGKYDKLSQEEKDKYEKESENYDREIIERDGYNFDKTIKTKNGFPNELSIDGYQITEQSTKITQEAIHSTFLATSFNFCTASLIPHTPHTTVYAKTCIYGPYGCGSAPCGCSESYYRYLNLKNKFDKIARGILVP